MRSMYGKITYTYCTYVIGKNNVPTIRTITPWWWIFNGRLATGTVANMSLRRLWRRPKE